MNSIHANSAGNSLSRAFQLREAVRFLVCKPLQARARAFCVPMRRLLESLISNLRHNDLSWTYKLLDTLA